MGTLQPVIDVYGMVGRNNKNGGVAVKLDKLERALSHMSNKALLKFVKRCVCRSLPNAGKTEAEAREALDMVYVECSRRGKERLYDTAYASITHHPERCDIY